MASYEYSDTYYGTYFLFVTDTDTGSGADASARVSPHGTDASSLTADAFGSIHATLSSADTGSVNPSTGETGSIGSTQPKTGSDTASGAEGIPLIGFGDDDYSNNYEVELANDSDSGSFADLGVLSAVSADTGSGADAVVLLAAASADSFLVFDQAQSFQVGTSDTDSGSAAETTGFLPAFPIYGTDASSLTADAVESTLPDITSSDSVTGADAVSSIHISLSDTDAGSFADAGGPLVPLSSADASSRTADAELLTVPGADTGSGTDAVTRIHLSAADTGSAVDNQGFPDNPYGSDTGHFADAGSVVAYVASADSGQWTEVSVNATPSWLLYGTLESFSLVRGAVLSGGIESAQLYGMREGKLTTSYSEFPSSSDDTVVMVWASLEYVEIEVNGGFLPFPALTTIYGWPVSTLGAEYSVAYGLQRMPAAMPMVLRANGRNYNGQPRTFDLLFYQVQFLTVHTQRAYKTGMECDYTAYATMSYTDEVGNALAVPEIGRMVDSPGQLTGAIGSLFGRGT